jgi:hypothetical protein
MLRILVMVLIAANVLYFGWAHWVARPAPVLTAVASTGKPAKRRPEAPPPCATLGPFHDELLADQSEKQLTAAGWRVQRRAASEDINDGWWVYVTNAGAAAQTRTLNALRSAGIRDVFSMTDSTDYRVSAGLFTDEKRAQDRADQLKRLKLQPEVTERRKQQPVIWFDLPGVAREALGDGRLNDSGLPLEQLRIENCPSQAPESAPAPSDKPAETAPADGGDASKTAATSLADVRSTRGFGDPRV